MISCKLKLIMQFLQNASYMYYSAGLLSRVDKFPEHQKYLSGSKRKKNKDKKDKERKIKVKEEPLGEESNESIQVCILVIYLLYKNLLLPQQGWFAPAPRKETRGKDK